MSCKISSLTKSLFPLIACTTTFVSADLTTVYEPGKSVIVQYGAPRSATTLQYEILKYVTSRVNLDVGLSRTDGEYVPSWKNFKPSPNVVYKSHSLRYFEDAIGNKSLPVMLFMTAETDEVPAVDERVVYVQSKSRVEENALSVIDDYAKIFKLTKRQTDKAKAFIKVWDIRRLCCGLQQSLTHRLILHKCPPIIPWFDAANPQCELYNLEAVDTLFRFYNSNEIDLSDFTNLDQIIRERHESDEYSCLNVQAAIEGGKDFNGEKFVDCPSLVKHYARHKYDEYVCRNKEYASLCNSKLVSRLLER